MKLHKILFSILLLGLVSGLTACSEDLLSPGQSDIKAQATEKAKRTTPVRNHATGEVFLVWKGRGGPTANPAPGGSRVGVAQFAAHEPCGDRPAKGTFFYQVLDDTGGVHRVVTAEITGVAIDPELAKVWMIGQVVADTKGCAAGPGGGHGDGCGDDHGGCDGGHDDGHDGGCDGGHDDGEHDDGGCDGGHDDGEHDDSCGGGSSPGGSRGASGRFCRTGQIIAAKAHDEGSPGEPFDGITWKWFLADHPDLPDIGNIADWPHLCRKEITAGSLVVHVGTGGLGPPSRD